MNITSNTTLSSYLTGLSVDEILDQWGFQLWQDSVNHFFVPTIALSGAGASLLNAWILIKHRSKFTDPVFVYFRLLSLVCLAGSLIILPNLFCYSPRFFPSIDTYACGICLLIGRFLIPFFYHYCSTLEISILLTRMKAFNPFIKKHFIISPKTISLVLFLACLIIGLPVLFSISIVNRGDFYYFDADGLRHTATFYDMTSSQFVMSLLGKLSLIAAYIFGVLFTLIVAVIVNVVSILQYKAYLMRLEREAAVIQMRINNIQPSSSSKSELKKLPVEIQKILNQKERNQRKIEKNMFGMALTLCTISIVSRILITVNVVLYLLFFSLSVVKVSVTLSLVTYALVFATPIFVFFKFNRAFRRELRRVFRRNRK